jgi:hypothetical protein
MHDAYYNEIDPKKAAWLRELGDRPGLRPVERGAFPLANGTPARVGRLRGYGDGIVAQAAEAFIRSYMSLARTDEQSAQNGNP